MREKIMNFIEDGEKSDEEIMAFLGLRNMNALRKIMFKMLLNGDVTMDMKSIKTFHWKLCGNSVKIISNPQLPPKHLIHNDMSQEVEMTHNEKVEVYQKLEKDELIEMLITASDVINGLIKMSEL